MLRFNAISIILLSSLFVQGCSKYIDIKSQSSSIKEIAKCITDDQSRGQCNSSDVSFAQAQSNLDYYSVLDELDFSLNPRTLSELSSLEGYSILISSENHAIKTFLESEYTTQGCEKNNNYQGFLIALNSLKSDSNKSIHNLYKSLANVGGADFADIKFNDNSFSLFVDSIGEAHSYGGFEATSCTTIRYFYSTANADKQAAALYLLRELSFTRKYLKAYFRNGRFIQGMANTGDLFVKLKEHIKKEAKFLSEEQVNDLAKKTFKKFTGKEHDKACPGGGDCAIKFSGKLEEKQFVSRAGVEYGFPHITVSIDPFAEKKIDANEVDWNIVGAEVVKVYVEAVGDNFIGLPADPRSTICNLVSSYCFETGKFGLDEDQFAKVNEHADKVETAVTNAVGKTIRGLGWFSLNNEAVAKIIETAIGAVSKKVAEKVAFCTYSCREIEPSILSNYEGQLIKSTTIEVSK